MLQNVEANREETLKREVKKMLERRMIILRARRGRASISNLKGTTMKKTRNDEMELVDLESEEESPIKWRDYEIETVITICGEMEDKFAK